MPSRQRKNIVALQIFDYLHIWRSRETSPPTGCSKRLSGKAAASEDPEAYPLGYVEDLSDARTPLADFFSILLDMSACIFEGQVSRLNETNFRQSSR